MLPPVTYVPGLDGLRAVAVVAVLLFHAEFGAASGGFLGVSLFFTLSGFLITTLLLAEYDSTGTLSLRHFYARRARRLLPAAYVCLALVVVASAWWAADQQRSLPGDVLASVANVANWRFAFSSTSYQDLFLGEPSPVAHFWSLAIEEQIYLVLPLVVYAALRRGQRALAFTTGALLVASVSATLLTSDPDLIYNGTHTRAAELLVGVALAQALRHRTLSPPVTGGPARALPGALALAAFIVLVATASLGQSWIYDGGLLGVGLVSAVLIAAVVDGRFPATLLAARPLVAIGKVSYGIYLFHWPVFLLLDEQRTGLDQIPLFALRCAVTAALTVASYVLIEQPVRRGRVISRDRVMAPALVLSAIAVAVVAVLAVPTPPLTQTEQLLSLGEQEVIDFATMGAADVGDVATRAPVEVGQLDESSAPDAPGRDDITFRDDLATAMSVAPTPGRVVVLGSDAAVVAALVGDGRPDEFDVVDGVRVDCPLSSADVVGCDRLVDHWNAVGTAQPADVVVIATSDAEVSDAFSRKLASQTDQELRQLGADDDAAVAATLAAIDAVLAMGTDVVWYTPVDSAVATFWNFSRIAVERPAIRTLVGSPPDALVETVRDLVSRRRAATASGDAAGAEVVASPDSALRLLVIGDSTSLNFSWALHDGSDGRVEVLWAGANGCPFAAVVATRGRADGGWTDPQCTPWSVKVAPLLASFRPDALLVMSGPTELQEHMLADNSTGSVATQPSFTTGREQQLDALLAVVGPDLPVLVADLPTIAEGRFSGGEMMSLDRLDAVNGQIIEWDERFDQVRRFPYRNTLELAEALRPPDDPIRSDGAHPDIEPLTELARTVYVDELLLLVDAVRVQMAPPFGS